MMRKYPKGTCSIFLFVLQTAYSTLNIKSQIKPITQPALGRPFALGDLYDRKRDLIIPGPKIWSNNVMSKYDETMSHSTNFEVSASHTVDDDCTSFDIKASMKASFLSGMVSVGGSASYLQNKIGTADQARVSLKYQSTTFTRSIQPDSFTKATYKSVLESETDATDVVSAIQYGAGAVFAFDWFLQSGENKRSIEGMLQVAIKKIPSLVIEGKGKVNISHADKIFTDKFLCTFHGDFVLKEHPGNYEEAIAVYKNLPSLLGRDYENSVPITVWLYPISMLPFSKRLIQLHHIQENIITSIADEIEKIDANTRIANSILTHFVSDHHPRIKKNVASYKEYIQLYKVIFQQKVAELLPKLRTGIVSNGALMLLLDEKKKSPFNNEKLKAWIKMYTEEVQVLGIISDLPNYCKGNGEFSSVLLNDVQFTISLVLKLKGQRDAQLEFMKNYLQNRKHSWFDIILQFNKWWSAGNLPLLRLQQFATMIKNYDVLEQKSRKTGMGSNIQFAVMEKDIDKTQNKPEVIIEVYENGKLAADNVQIPANVNDVEIVSIKYDSVKLLWSLPKQGFKNVLHYNVVVYEQQQNSYSNRSLEFQKDFTIDKGTKTSANVFGLKASKLYAFSVETYCFLGKSAESLMTNSIKTKTCPIGMYHKNQHNCEPCKPGEYSDTEGSHTCYRCYQGTYSDKYYSSKCGQCPAGTYNDKMGQTKCINCPAGTYSDFKGAFAIWFCKKCPFGTYNKENGKSSSKHCLNCPIGSYSSNEGTTRCSLCPFGSKTEQSGCKSPSCCRRNKEPLDKVIKSLVRLKSAVILAVKKASADEIGLHKRAKLIDTTFEKAKEGVGNQLTKGTTDADHFFKTHVKE